MIVAALTDPKTLNLPFACWTPDRLQAYLHEVKGIWIKRSRIDELLLREGLRWHQQETWFDERVDPRLRRKKGRITTLYTTPPPGSIVVCLDEMGPESAKSFPGREPVVVRQPAPAEVTSSKPAGPVGQATQEADHGRRGKGYVFGAFRPADGEALTAPYAGRTTANDVDFPARVEAWIPPDIERTYAVMDNLSAIGPPMSCCSPWHTLAGSSSSGRNMRPT